MPQRQLNIRSDEAYDRATRLSKQLSRTTTDVVLEALRLYENKAAPVDEKGFTPEQRARYDSVIALLDELAAHRRPDAPVGHDWLYDDDGLPK